MKPELILTPVKLYYYLKWDFRPFLRLWWVQVQFDFLDVRTRQVLNMLGSCLSQTAASVIKTIKVLYVFSVFVTCFFFQKQSCCLFSVQSLLQTFLLHICAVFIPPRGWKVRLSLVCIDLRWRRSAGPDYVWILRSGSTLTALPTVFIRRLPTEPPLTVSCCLFQTQGKFLMTSGIRDASGLHLNISRPNVLKLCISRKFGFFCCWPHVGVLEPAETTPDTLKRKRRMLRTELSVARIFSHQIKCYLNTKRFLSVFILIKILWRLKMNSWKY